MLEKLFVRKLLKIWESYSICLAKSKKQDHLLYNDPVFLIKSLRMNYYEKQKVGFAILS